MDDLEKGTSPGTAASRENAPSARQQLKKKRGTQSGAGEFTTYAMPF